MSANRWWRRQIWRAYIFNHMKWFQQDLDLMRKSAKREFSQERPMPCRFCGKVIRVNMYRHVARLHLDLVQLWRCPIAWCTTWKGSPQDCLEHLRNGHDVPWISKTASIEKYAPPWTVRRQLWTESLRVEHSGISTDILLFQWAGIIADAALPSIQRRFAPCSVSYGLHWETPGSSATTATYGRGVSVAAGNRTRGDTYM